VNATETAALLTLAAAYDQRTIGEADVLAWQAILGPTSFADAQTAVKAHYATKRDRVMPVDVIDGVRKIRNDRLERYESWVQPGPELTAAQYRDWLRDTRQAIADGWVPPEPAELDKARRDQLDAAIAPTFAAVTRGADDADSA
jgi:hypothetical protein